MLIVVERFDPNFFVFLRSESATDDRQRIIIPFFTLFVKDLYIAKESLDFSISCSEGPRAFDMEKAARLPRATNIISFHLVSFFICLFFVD